MIDLRRDTLTRPTPEVLHSILTAPPGDDSRDGDPTVRELEAAAAAIRVTAFRLAETQLVGSSG